MSARTARTCKRSNSPSAVPRAEYKGLAHKGYTPVVTLKGRLGTDSGCWGACGTASGPRLLARVPGRSRAAHGSGWPGRPRPGSTSRWPYRGPSAVSLSSTTGLGRREIAGANASNKSRCTPCDSTNADHDETTCVCMALPWTCCAATRLCMFSETPGPGGGTSRSHRSPMQASPLRRRVL